MSTDSALALSDAEEVERMLAGLGWAGLRPGDWVIEPTRGDCYRVRAFARQGVYNVETKVSEPVGPLGVRLEYTVAGDEETWRARDWMAFARLAKEYVRLDRPPGDESLDALAAELAALDTAANVEETALAVSATPDMLRALRAAIFTKRNRTLAIQGLIQRKVGLAMHQAAGLARQLAYLGKVIEVGNLYLGTGEEIVVVREGEPAPIEVPVYLCQLVRYMDEEVGIVYRHKHGQSWKGLDFRDVAEFDAWLLEPGNLDRVLPGQKGVAMFRATRQESDSGSKLYDFFFDRENKHVYVLIRNGRQLYRIWTTLVIGELMYPKLGEWQRLMGIKEGAVRQDIRERRYLSDSDVEKREFDYRKTIALLQGLIDRTTTLHPLPPLINLFDDATYEGLVVFVRDAEIMLGATSRPSYGEWQAGINAKIAVGTRVYVGPIPYEGPDEKGWRWPRVYMHHYPAKPGPGVYEVVEIMPKGQYNSDDFPLIRYNPGDKIYKSGWGEYDYEGHVRKVPLSFRLQRSDSFVLNYDELTVADLDYYIDARHERKDYLKLIPTLQRVRVERLAEEAREAGFVALVAGRTGKGEEEIRTCIAWWKRRTKYKRGLTTDDAKALRMIERALVKGAWRKEWASGTEDADLAGGA